MADPPPPYEGIAATELVVHLQVWHYNETGRCPKHNDQLAALFHDNEVWEVIPLDLVGETGLNCHDFYVPVEVRFRHRTRAYNDPGEHPLYDVRELFKKTAPQFIYQFFTGINSAPHNLNIFPVGVPEEFVSRYTHAYVLDQLSLRVRLFVVPEVVATRDVQNWLHNAVITATDVLPILAAIVSFYALYRTFREDAANGIGAAGIQRAAQDRHIWDVDVPQRLNELGRLFEQFRHEASNQPAERAAALSLAAKPLDEYVRLANRMDNRLEKLENQGNDAAISNQDLYELVWDARDAALLLGTLKQAVQPLVDSLEEGYDKEINGYKRRRNRTVVSAAALTTLAVFFCWNPAGWAAAAAAAAAANIGVSHLGVAVGAAALDAVTIATHCRVDASLRVALAKKENVREFAIAIKTLYRSVNQVRAALAVVFSSQVMRKRMDDILSDHAKMEIFKLLGVDIGTLSGNERYSPELIRDRLQDFRRVNNTLREMKGRVEADGNFEIQTRLEQVAGVSV